MVGFVDLTIMSYYFSGVSAGERHIMPYYLTANNNVVDALCEIIWFGVGCLITKVIEVEEDEIGIISFFYQPLILYSEVICRKSRHFMYDLFECKYSLLLYEVVYRMRECSCRARMAFFFKISRKAVASYDALRVLDYLTDVILAHT